MPSKTVFFRFLSLQIFHESLGRSELTVRLGELKQYHCLPMDEFQYVFGSKTLFSMAKDFFRILGSSR